MSQQQQQQLIRLKPETLFPKWSQYIDYCVKTGKKDNDLKRELGIDAYNAKYCVVGEAHNFSKSYDEDCKICRLSGFGQGSNSFTGFITDEVEKGHVSTNTNWRELAIVKNFVNHFEAVHT